MGKKALTAGWVHCVHVQLYMCKLNCKLGVGVGSQAAGLGTGTTKEQATAKVTADVDSLGACVRWPDLLIVVLNALSSIRPRPPNPPALCRSAAGPVVLLSPSAAAADSMLPGRCRRPAGPPDATGLPPSSMPAPLLMRLLLLRRMNMLRSCRVADAAAVSGGCWKASRSEDRWGPMVSRSSSLLPPAAQQGGWRSKGLTQQGLINP